MLSVGVVDVDAKIAARDDSARPGKVIVAILTDGQENSSQEYTKDMVSTLISDKEKLGWEFIYLSADVNAMSDAVSFGVRGSNVFLYETTPEGCVSSYTNLNNSITNYRNTGTVSGMGIIIGDEDK
jgi:hypothetical protein